ncbi:MAG: hypothetical protein ABIQ44_14125, partial [Chloroflexia bacterium]
MSNMEFDARSEEELAALESSTTSDLLKSAAQAVVLQPQFVGRLEAQLRALPVGSIDATRVSISEDDPVSADRASRRTTPIADNGRSPSRIWRVASVGMGLA